MRDAITMADSEGGITGVQKDHANLAPIVGIDGAGAIQQRDPMPQREARARANLCLEPLWQCNGEARGDQCAGTRGKGQAAGALVRREIRTQVHPCRLRGFIGGQRDSGIRALGQCDLNRGHSNAWAIRAANCRAVSALD